VWWLTGLSKPKEIFMTFSILLSHGWKKFRRSVSFERETAVAVFLGIVAFMMVMYCLIMGFALDSLITKTLGQPDSISFLNSLLIYYFLSEFIIRYMMQGLPALDVQPYLHLPIRKSTMIHYLLVKSLGHILNVLVFLLFAPFAFKVVAAKYGISIGWSWLLTLCLFSLAVHYLFILFKKKLDDTIWGILALVGIISFISAADFFGWFKLSTLSLPLFSWAFQGYFLFVFAFLLVGILYWVNFKFFLSSMYPEELSLTRENIFSDQKDIAFLKNFGAIGDWINLEVKLILRNKRPRSLLFVSFLLLLYGLVFYNRDNAGGAWIYFFVGILITGAFTMNYGQFLYSWQGGHFDFIVTRPISLRQYIESKYWIFGIVTIAYFVVSIPYVYFGWNVLLINTIMTLYNIGVNTIVIMNIAMWEPKKIDLKKGTTLNYEGMGAAQWLMSLPVLIGPYLFYIPFSIAGYPTIGLVTIAFVGILAIVLRPYLLDLTAKRLLERKHTIAAGFRKE
jgi:hypothetical protein